MELHFVWYVVIFIFGLCFGSFFNVAIHRWPFEDRKKREWINTPSHCPKCGARIRWYDNIPLVSYFVLLRGKCRDCKTPIAIRYPLVELGTAVIWIITTWLVTHYGHSGVSAADINVWHIVITIALASLYLLTVIIDLETSIIPFEVTVPHLVIAWLYIWLCKGASVSSGWIDSLIGMVVLALIFFLLFLPGWMGDADIYLVAGFGVLFGWKLGLTAVFLGIVMGGLYGLVLIIKLILQRRYKVGTEVPFGPYLAIAAYICLFFGGPILDWYLGFFQPAGAGNPSLPLMMP